MAKAKFGIGDIIDIRGQKAGTAGQAGAATLTETSGDAGCQGYREIWLNPREVKPSESNFYSQENIEELADSFLTVGQQQPTVLARINGEYRIVSGHRRNLANIKNLERGYKEYEKVRYLYKGMTPAMLELSLLMGNACNRELTPWEKTQQAQRLKEALRRAKKEDGLEIQGKLRDIIADLMHESSSNIAKMNSIRKNAAPEIQEEFRKGSIGISAAYEASKLSPAEQRVIADKTAKGEAVPVKEIAGKAEKKNCPAGRQKVFDSNTFRNADSQIKNQSENGGMDRMKRIIRCSECGYCREFRPVRNTRSSFTCEHLDSDYIHQYFLKHKMQRMERFIAYGERGSHEVPLKTSSRWGPRKAENSAEL